MKYSILETSVRGRWGTLVVLRPTRQRYKRGTSTAVVYADQYREASRHA